MSTARAMATICCTAREQRESSCLALAGIFRPSRISVVRLLRARQLIKAPLALPMNIFSATVRLGQRVISWYTVLMPISWASWGEWIFASPVTPSIRMLPASFSYTPVSTLISVDFPAPFSPIRAWISPLRRVKSTLFSALVPGNCLQIPRMVNTT